MTAPGNNMLQIVLALAFVVASGYASGRIHQWYRHGLERDHAYREGYNHASHSLFGMAVQNRAMRTPAAPKPAATDRPARSPLAVVGERTTGRIGLARRRISPAPASPAVRRHRRIAG
jgi:hypothetical protein